MIFFEGFSYNGDFTAKVYKKSLPNMVAQRKIMIIPTYSDDLKLSKNVSHPRSKSEGSL